MKNEKLISVGLWLISGLLGVLISLIVVIWGDHNKRQDEDKELQRMQLNETRRLIAGLTDHVNTNTTSIEEIRKYILVRDGVDVNKIDFNDLVERLKAAAKTNETAPWPQGLTDYLVDNRTRIKSID